MKIAFQRLLLKSGPDRDNSRPDGPSGCRNTRMGRFAIDFDKTLAQKNASELQSHSSIAVALGIHALQLQPLPSDRRGPACELTTTSLDAEPAPTQDEGLVARLCARDRRKPMVMSTATKNADQRALEVDHAWSMPPLATRSKGAAAGHESDAIRSRIRGQLSRCPQPIEAGRPLPCHLHRFGGVQRSPRA